MAKRGDRRESDPPAADSDLVSDFRLSDPIQTPRYLPSPGEGVDAIELYGEKTAGPSSDPADGVGSGGSSDSPKPGDRVASSGSARSTAGEDTVGVQCPLCHSRLHVTTRKVGHSVRCPDCHCQFTAKPYRVPGKKKSKAVTNSEGDEEIRLGETCPLPKFQPLTRGEVSRAELDAADRHARRRESSGAAAQSASSPTGGAKLGGDVLKVICPHCQTRHEVVASEIGGTMTCGDCGNRVKIETPRVRSRSAQQAVTTEREEDLAISSKTWEDHRRRADVREARRLYQAERKREAKRLDEVQARTSRQTTYSRRLFSFLREPEVISRMFLLVILFAMTTGLGTWIWAMAASDDAGRWVFAAPLSVFLAISLMMTSLYGASIAITVLQDTAEELPVIETWSFEVMEWFYQAAQIFFAAAAAGGLASVASLALSSLPLPSVLIALVMLGIVFLAFPVILLSILEGESLLSFVSPIILASLANVIPAWCQFYSAAVLLAVLLAMAELAAIWGGPLVALLIAPVIVLGGLLYFRALGLLACRCSVAMGELQVPADAGADEEK